MKTIEESAELNAKEAWGIYFDDVDEDCNATRGENSIKDFKAGVEFAQRWIPVEEELPEVLTDVLIKQSNGKIDIGCLMSLGFNVEMIDNKNKVTHWRPIERK